MYWLFPKAFFSKNAWLTLYNLRKLTKPEEGARTRLSVIISLILSSFLVAFIISNNLENKSSLSFLKDKKDVILIDNDDLVSIYVSQSKEKQCNTDIECLNLLKDQTNYKLSISDFYNNLNQKLLNILDTHLLNESKINNPKIFIRLLSFNVKFNKDIVKDIVTKISTGELNKNSLNLGLVVPYLSFNEALLFINGKLVHKYFESEFIHYPIDNLEDLYDLKIDVMLYSNLSRTKNLINKRGQELFVGSYKTINQYKTFVKNYDNYHEKIGALARIILALFCLILFLIVDSSPESLGLAFFMGFEAAGMTLGYYGMKISWLPSNIRYDFLQHYCWAMGDIFRLYFLLQLSRVVGKNILPWLILGSIYSIPYAYLRHIAPDRGYDWVLYTWVWRDLVVATIGSVMCTRTAILIRGQGLKWREFALWIASFATSAQILHALFQYFPQISGSIYYVNFLSVIETNSAYLFALSTFINISTLENRVKQLSLDIAKNKIIEQELELGRRVQQEFLKIPSLPKDIDLKINYEAYAYVSGDTYFVKFDEELQLLTVILVDIQGHGVQAAIRASVCNMIARTLWDSDISDGVSLLKTSKLAKYDQLLAKLLYPHSSNEYIAFVGLELNIETGTLFTYRSNYNFPIIFQPNTLLSIHEWQIFDENIWNIKPTSLINKNLQHTQLYPGAFVLILSDGYINSSQNTTNLTEYLKSQLKMNKNSLNANNIKNLINNWDKEYNKSILDDKTMIVLQWLPTKLPSVFKHKHIA